MCVFVWVFVSCVTGSHSAVQAELESLDNPSWPGTHSDPLALAFKCWDYRHASPSMASMFIFKLSSKLGHFSESFVGSIKHCSDPEILQEATCCTNKSLAPITRRKRGWWHPWLGTSLTAAPVSFLLIFQFKNFPGELQQSPRAGEQRI